jgi:hypothetical protein
VVSRQSLPLRPVTCFASAVVAGSACTWSYLVPVLVDRWEVRSDRSHQPLPPRTDPRNAKKSRTGVPLHSGEIPGGRLFRPPSRGGAEWLRGAVEIGERNGMGVAAAGERDLTTRYAPFTSRCVAVPDLGRTRPHAPAWFTPGGGPSSPASTVGRHHNGGARFVARGSLHGRWSGESRRPRKPGPPTPSARRSHPWSTAGRGLGHSARIVRRGCSVWRESSRRRVAT